MLYLRIEGEPHTSNMASCSFTSSGLMLSSTVLALTCGIDDQSDTAG